MTTEDIQEVLHELQMEKNNRANYINNIKIIMDANERITLLDEAHNSL